MVKDTHTHAHTLIHSSQTETSQSANTQKTSPPTGTHSEMKHTQTVRCSSTGGKLFSKLNLRLNIHEIYLY